MSPQGTKGYKLKRHLREPTGRVGTWHTPQHTHRLTHEIQLGPVLKDTFRKPQIDPYQRKRKAVKPATGIPFSPAAWLEIWASPGRLLASLARPPLVSSWWMAVGFPPAEAPSARDVATGMVRTMVPAPVVMVPRFWMVAGVFTAEAC